MIEALVFGVLIGMLLGLTGAGGGVLAVPALVLGLGWPITQAAPVALMAVGSAAALGAIDGLRKGLVRYRAALLMAALGAMMAPWGLYVAHRLSSATLATLFSVVLVVVAVRMIKANGSTEESGGWQQKNCMLDPATGRLHWTRKCAATLAILGACCGFLSGLLGVGGGFLLVPAFRQLTDIRVHGVVATSLMVVALVSTVAIVGALRTGVSIPAAGGGFIAACLVGMLCGRLLAPWVPAQALQRLFAGVCLTVATYLLVHTWG
ncbi:sulfite exporter TauE/SafE family protein [Pseudomonas sp. MWU16-30317]|uniref:sulfite exporter TauE/SafE family protein n=1 Tax=Pseudomonas sp. MWU16-30317 TaxID=2878095 RepID=UPI001CFB57A4|nr:sulfite exporter TauE/SafE family protein [Pseudomonas sp. MWU16-30317]